MTHIFVSLDPKDAGKGEWRTLRLASVDVASGRVYNEGNEKTIKFPSKLLAEINIEKTTFEVLLSTARTNIIDANEALRTGKEFYVKVNSLYDAAAGELCKEILKHMKGIVDGGEITTLTEIGELRGIALCSPAKWHLITQGTLTKSSLKFTKGEGDTKHVEGVAFTSLPAEPANKNEDVLELNRNMIVEYVESGDGDTIVIKSKYTNIVDYSFTLRLTQDEAARLGRFAEERQARYS